MFKYSKMICGSLLLLMFIIHECVGPPTVQQKKDNNSTQPNSKSEHLEDEVEYKRYLQQVAETLEQDKEFQAKLERAGEADIRSGKVAAELEFVSHHVRTKLDELKRIEIQRLKELVKQSDFLEKKQKGLTPNYFNVVGHLDHTNEHTFEVADLHRLITKVRLDLEEADKRRRNEFKEYEMQKKFEQEEKLRAMDEEHRKQYQENLEAQKKKHEKHDPIHHPGSKAQLEEVWEKEDHMDRESFNPKAFFHLHDLDGNGYLDEEELKALFVKELEKMYQDGVPEDDMREREEEMERMREHVFKEADTDKDRLISYAEFLKNTQKEEFEKDEGWETIDQKPQFSQKEYEEFERSRREEVERLINQGLLQPYPQPGMMPPPQYGSHPAQYQQHGQPAYVQPLHPNEIPQYQYGSQMQYHPPPNAGQVHPNQIHQQQQQYQHNSGQVQSQHQPAGQQQYQQPQQHAGQQAVPPAQYHQPTGVHPNEIPKQQPQVQYQNQVPAQYPNQIPQQHQQQYQPVVSNEIPKQAVNQMGTQQQQQHQINQQVHPNQMAGQPQANQPQVQGNNIQQGQPQVPHYQEQQQQQQQNQPQSNNIPQTQYQSKYEPHSNQIGSNDKNQQHIPK